MSGKRQRGAASSGNPPRVSLDDDRAHVLRGSGRALGICGAVASALAAPVWSPGNVSPLWVRRGGREDASLRSTQRRRHFARARSSTTRSWARRASPKTRRNRPTPAPKRARGFGSGSRSLKCETHHSRFAGSPRRACLPAFGLDERHQQLKRLRSKHVRWHRSGGHTLRATVNRDTEPSPWLEPSSGWIARQRVRTSHRAIRSSRRTSLREGSLPEAEQSAEGARRESSGLSMQRASTCSSRLQRSRSQTAAVLGGARHLVRARPRERRATQAAKADTFPPELPSARLQSESRSPHS